jgi:putative ATPase
MGRENLQLFSEPAPRKKAAGVQPLADELRPSTWEKYQGVEELDPKLTAQLQKGAGRPPSLILWGPPGSGKTTLARLIGSSYKCNFVQFSAVLGGVKEIRDIVAAARESALPTILFVDEIHRFNKGQQDAFLPHVESGTISLIGATTENPSFSLTSALLSRVKVVVLPSLSKKALREIAAQGAAAKGLRFEAKALEIIVEMCGGDARKLLNLIESLAQSGIRNAADERGITDEELKSYLKDAKTLFYDRSGEEHYNMVSAFIKSMRGSDADAALYWAFRMIESGEDPRFIIRRMMIFASEDVGNADPRGLQLAVATHEAFERLGLPEGRIPIAQCVTYLATAPKSNRSYVGMNKAIAAIKEQPKVAVPLHLRNAPTGLMKELGYGEEYAYPHDFQGGYAPGVRYLPDEVAGQRFYEPSERGYEKNIRERLELLRRK